MTPVQELLDRRNDLSYELCTYEDITTGLYDTQGSGLSAPDNDKA